MPCCSGQWLSIFAGLVVCTRNEGLPQEGLHVSSRTRHEHWTTTCAQDTVEALPELLGAVQAVLLDMLALVLANRTFRTTTPNRRAALTQALNAGAVAAHSCKPIELHSIILKPALQLSAAHHNLCLSRRSSPSHMLILRIRLETAYSASIFNAPAWSVLRCAGFDGICSS